MERELQAARSTWTWKGCQPRGTGERTGVSADDEHSESPWAGLGVSWMHLSLTQGSLSDALMSAHVLGKGRSIFVALELKLDDRDHGFQLKQPSWVPSEWRD